MGLDGLLEDDKPPAQQQVSRGVQFSKEKLLDIVDQSRKKKSAFTPEINKALDRLSTSYGVD